MSRFRYRRQTIAGLAVSQESAQRIVDLMRQRFEAGTTGLADVLEAERQLIAAQQSLAGATAGLTSDYIAIQKALGLGWEQAAAPGLEKAE